MKTKLTATVLATLLLTALAAGAWAKPVNKPGARVDIKAHLVADKTNIVHFYLPASRMSKKMEYELSQFEEKNAGDIAVLTVHVGSADSAVARQYKITTFPSFQIYDAKGNLDMEGSEAYNQVARWLGVH